MEADYCESLRQWLVTAARPLLAGVGSVYYTDFPDYPNVGDSALSLGALRLLREFGINVERIYSINTISNAVLNSDVDVVLSGGGSLGGLYPPISEHRYLLAERLRPDRLLIQMPQSVSFVDDRARREFADRMATRGRVRIAVRDRKSQRSLNELGTDALLVPDTVHALGRISAGEPQARIVALVRTDAESARLSGIEGAVDWLRDPPTFRLRTRARWQTARLGRVRSAFNSSDRRWIDDAGRRLARGVSILASGEVVVTDRLHAMLLALQIGRRVVAVDNSTGKLSSYAETWLGFALESSSLAFAEDFEGAMDLARAWTR